MHIFPFQYLKPIFWPQMQDIHANGDLNNIYIHLWTWYLFFCLAFQREIYLNSYGWESPLFFRFFYYWQKRRSFVLLNSEMSFHFLSHLSCVHLHFYLADLGSDIFGPVILKVDLPVMPSIHWILIIYIFLSYPILIYIYLSYFFSSFAKRYP